MRTRTLLLIIDMQNDFCKPEGALYVNGAESDVARLVRFLTEHSDDVGHIIMTQDNHHVTDISHPVFWEDTNGDPPPPFTIISSEDVLTGVWKPRFEAGKAVEYIRNLERQGEFPHTIWPEHCIIGSTGAAITDEIMEPVKAWARKGRYYDLVIKGTNPLTEHFGALMANVPDENSPETQLNTGLVDKLRTFDEIIVAGEAKSHCVATTVKQMLTIENTGKKLVILEDCMSDVTGFETLALPIYENARINGAKFILSNEWHPQPLKED
jgi:nicotinamidase/pyrazinamidase